MLGHVQYFTIILSHKNSNTLYPFDYFHIIAQAQHSQIVYAVTVVLVGSSLIFVFPKGPITTEFYTEITSD